MDITPLIAEGSQIIQSYGGGRFRISGRDYGDAVIVFPDRVLPWQIAGGDAASPAEADLRCILEHVGAVDVVLIGCGAAGMMLPPALRGEFSAQGMTAEAMDTGAACRTYNVLLAEGRRVAAMLRPL